MSDYVRYKGKVKKINIVPREYETFLIMNMSGDDYEKYNSYVSEGNEFDNNHELLSWYDSIGDNYILTDNGLYEVLEKFKMDSTTDIYESHKNEDGTIDFHVMYYNGGYSFDEAVDNASEEKL